MNRRDFLKRSTKTSLGVAAGWTILNNPKSVRAAPANERVMLASVGVRGRGGNLAADFAVRPDCRIAYICDVDANLFPATVKRVAPIQGGADPVCVQDFRKALDDKNVDAIVVATPDHWHCLATILGCQAGKDVYVEKPLSHSAWEGRKAIEAARKYNRVVQVGMQNRSAPYVMAAKKYLDDGRLGKVHLCRVYDHKGGAEALGNFPAEPDRDPPEGFDWDMWNGPAPEARYNANCINHWHSLWRYAGGDMVNDAVHQLDIARWLMGVEYPKSVYCTGGRFADEGIAEAPDTQIANFELDNLLMTVEMTLYTPYMLKESPQIRQSPTEHPYWPQNSTRVEIFGSEGFMVVIRHGGGWQVFLRPQREKPVLKDQDKGLFPDPEHKENFIQCIRSRELPNADVEKGHRSALWVHYANISLRTGGQKLKIDPKTEDIIGNPEATTLLRRTYRKPWVVPEVV
jgi:predicted dehydrogenase